MQLAQHRVFYIIEQGRSENTLVASEVDWLQEWCTIHVVSRTPGTVHPMGTGLKDIMLEVMLVLEQHTYGFCLFGELLQAPEVPFVKLRQVIFGHSVPGQFLTTRAGKRLFIERCPDITILATYTLMVITTSVCPQSIVLTEQQGMRAPHLGNHRVHTIRTTQTFLPGDKASQGIFSLGHCGIGCTAIPPRCLVFASYQYGIVLGQPSVHNSIMMGTEITRRNALILKWLQFAGSNVSSKDSRINPLAHSSTWLQRFLCHLHGLLNGGRRRCIGIAFQHAALKGHIPAQAFLQL